MERLRDGVGVANSTAGATWPLDVASQKRGLSKQKWGLQMDVVFVGAFKSEGHYGHMGMYPFSI